MPPVKFVNCRKCDYRMELAEAKQPPCEIRVVCPRCETPRRVKVSANGALREVNGRSPRRQP